VGPNGSRHFGIATQGILADPRFPKVPERMHATATCRMGGAGNHRTKQKETMVEVLPNKRRKNSTGLLILRIRV